MYNTLQIGREYKEQVLQEWRKREKARSGKWQKLVEANRFDIKKKAAQVYHYVKTYVNGEFGEPTDKDHKDFLLSAVEGDYYACRIWLLKFGEIPGAIDCRNELDGRTALSIVAGSGNQKVMALLLSRNPDVDAVDRFGCTALHYACANGQFECAALLLEEGAEIDARDRFGVTPLMKAAECGDVDLIELLLEFAAAPNIRDKVEKWTALHYAAKGGDPDCVMLLLKNRVDYDTSSSTKQTAYDVALDFKRKKAAIVLMKWRRRRLIAKKGMKVIEGLDWDSLDLD